ncbi:Protein LAZ1 homolog 1 [Linum perenne]
MGWIGVTCSLFWLFTLAESTSRLGKVWTLNLVSENVDHLSWPIYSASVFVLVALVLSMYLIFEHLASYNKPEEQKFLVGLILMVPVYSLESFLSLYDSSEAFNWEAIRDCYEAVAMYCFERYLIACLGGEDSTIRFMETQTDGISSTPLLDEAYAYGVVEHPLPLNCCLRPWNLGRDFYYAVKVGIVQYMIVKMICALIAIILEAFGVYGEGKFNWNYGYPYLAVVLNFSQSWALYCLVQFYSVTKDKLAAIKPLAKFLTFKSIIFLTWWQGIAVAFLFSTGIFNGSLAQEVIWFVKQMGVAAVVHLYVFPAAPYKRGERCVRNVAVMADYAALGTPADPEEVEDSERYTRVRLARHDERQKAMNIPQSVRDVVFGSSEIIVDDMKYTVSHVVEPVERGIAKINKTIHKISENVKRQEERKRNSKDDNFLVPLNSWTKEFSDVHENLGEGSVSDSGLLKVKKHQSSQSRATGSRLKRGR